MWSDSLASCGFDFQSVCPVMEKDKRLMGASWWERLRGKLGLVLMGGAMFSKSLIQFPVDGWGCVLSLWCTWGQTMVEVMKIMATSFKRSYAHTATLSALYPAAGHHWPTPLLETPGHSQTSLGQSLMGSLLLSPGSQWKHKVLLVLSKSLFPLSCVSSGSSMVDLMATSSRRAYSIPRSTAPRAPVSGAGHCWLYLRSRHSDTVLSQSL